MPFPTKIELHTIFIFIKMGRKKIKKIKQLIININNQVFTIPINTKLSSNEREKNEEKYMKIRELIIDEQKKSSDKTPLKMNKTDKSDSFFNFNSEFDDLLSSDLNFFDSDSTN